MLVLNSDNEALLRIYSSSRICVLCGCGSCCVLRAYITASRQEDKTGKQWLSFTGVETAVLTHAPNKMTTEAGSLRL